VSEARGSGHVQMSSVANAVSSPSPAGISRSVIFHKPLPRSGPVGRDSRMGRRKATRRLHANSSFECADSQADNIYQITVSTDAVACLLDEEHRGMREAAAS